MAGLGSIRLAPDPVNPDSSPYEPMEVDLSNDNPVDPDEATSIELDDGSVVVNIGPPARKSKEDQEFDDNLALEMSETELGSIADRLLRLIDSDNTARKEWLDAGAEGMKIMGMKIEPMRTNGADGSAPLEGMSNIRAVELCEAVVRFGANAFAELCPVDGPAKFTQIGKATPELDDRADDLESMINDYLIDVDQPYIPDTDAMLPRVGLEGSVFKKVYHDPILRRPVSRAVYGDDLIIDNSATSLFDAKRITHRVFMGKSTVQRMVIVGAYRDVELGSSQPMTDKSPQQRQQEEISGVTMRDSFEEDDSPYELYECYCELDLPGFEHEGDDKEPDGLAIPYKVVIAKEAKTIVEIRRNWAENDDMCLPKQWFVQFPFIRGFGVYCIGLSHLLGNVTNGITAMLREFIDAGMFANFPGLVGDKDVLRQNSNINRVPPAGILGLETGGRPIQQVVMALPYKSPDAVFAASIQQLQQTAQRLGGTADVMVGEGRQDAPVGTTLALIEQAIKPLLATHKRLCQAQGQELQLLVQRIKEDVEGFLRCVPEWADRWTPESLLAILKSRKIVPRADPNTASHLQRMLRNAGLYQIAKDEPAAFNVLRIRQMVIRGLGFADPDQFLNPNPQGAPPDPKALAAQTGAQADLIDAQTKAAELEFKKTNLTTEDQNRDLDRQSKMSIAGMQLKREQLIQQGESVRSESGNQKDLAQAHMNSQTQVAKTSIDHQQDSAEAARDRIHEALMQGHAQQHEIHTAGMEQAHDMRQAAMDHIHDAHQSTMDHDNARRLEAMKPKPAKPAGKKK